MPSSQVATALFALLSAAFTAHAQSSPDQRACFNAQNFLSLHQSKQPSLIYVWSPRMVLSVTQAAVVRSQAIGLKLDWIAVHDHRVPESEINQAQRALQLSQPLSAQALSGSRALCADALLQRDAYLHFPIAFVSSGGVLHDSKIIGAMPAVYWQSALAERLNALRADGAAGLRAD